MKKYQKNFEESVKQIAISIGVNEEQVDGYLFGVVDVIKDWSFIELDEIYEEGLGEGYSILSNEVYAVAAGYALLTHYGLDESEYRRWAKKQTVYNEYLLAIVDGLPEIERQKLTKKRERLIYESLYNEFLQKKKLIKFVEYKTGHVLFDKSIEIDSRLKDIIKLVEKFQEIEDYSVTILKKGLSNRCKDYKECSKNIVSVLRDGIDANWVKCKRYLKSLSVAEETIETIYEAYQEITEDVCEIENYLHDALMDLKKMAEGNVEKIVAKNRQRKEIEFQGGGIGIGAAVAGMIGGHIACSVNASIADFRTKKSAESLRKELERAANEIYLGLEAKNVYIEIVKFANKELRELCMSCLYDDSVESSVDIAEIFEKLHAEKVKNSITEERLKILYTEVLFTYPWEKSVYEEIITTYGIDSGLDNLAQYIGVDISKIKRKRLQKEQEERTEDGIIFATLEEKAVYIQERNLFKPLLEEIRKLNYYFDRNDFEQKVELLEKMQPQAKKYWKEEVANTLIQCNVIIQGVNVPNHLYILKFIESISVIKSDILITEKHEKYNSWVNYFGSKWDWEINEKIALLILSEERSPEVALIVSSHHIYYYHIMKNNQYSVKMFDFEQMYNIRYNVYDKKISTFHIKLTDNTSIYLQWLFEKMPIRISDACYMALNECIKIGYKRKSREKSEIILKETASMPLEEAYKVAFCYLKGREGFEKNEIAAVALLERLAERGYADAQWTLGYYFYYYRIEESFYSSFTSEDKKDRKQKEEKGIKYIEKAAENGQADAINKLGEFCSSNHNYIGKNIDDKKAVSLFEQAAKQGNSDALRNLSIHYSKGLGVKCDNEIALKLLLESANRGHSIAQVELAERYISGNGVKKSRDHAIYWYDRAAKKGHSQAVNEIKKYTNADIEKAIYNVNQSREKEQPKSAEFLKNESEKMKNLSAFFVKDVESAIKDLEKYVRRKEEEKDESYSEAMKLIASFEKERLGTFLFNVLNISCDELTIYELVKYGADINCRVQISTDNYATPLDVCIAQLQAETKIADRAANICRFLIQKGAERSYDFYTKQKFVSPKEYLSQRNFMYETFKRILGNIQDSNLDYGDNLEKSNKQLWSKAKQNFDVQDDEIYLIYDHAVYTLFRNYSKGFAICKRGIYFSNGQKKKIIWKDFADFKAKDVQDFVSQFRFDERKAKRIYSCLTFLRASFKYDEMDFNEEIQTKSGSDMQYCAACGKKILRSAKYCNFCGKKNNYKG